MTVVDWWIVFWTAGATTATQKQATVAMAGQMHMTGQGVDRHQICQP